MKANSLSGTDWYIYRSTEEDFIQGSEPHSLLKEIAPQSDYFFWKAAPEERKHSESTWRIIPLDTPSVTAWIEPVHGIYAIDPTSIRLRFERLKQQWKSASVHYSSVVDMAMLEPYQMIIGMGWAAVPLILKDLQQEPDHWFWALHAITGINPISEKDLGNIERMTEAWLEWGQEHSIIE